MASLGRLAIEDPQSAGCDASDDRSTLLGIVAFTKGATMVHVRTVVTAAALVLAAPVLAIAPASASPPHFETITEPLSNHFEDFCGVEGFSVDQTGLFQSRLKIRTSNSGLDYFMEHITIDEKLTGEASGDFVTIHTAFIAKDLKIVDNGDGTLTITQLLTGPSTLYGENGKALARDPGQVRFRLVIDTNGTPGDPEDDIELSFELIKGSTGRSDDYCPVIIDQIG